MESTARNIEIGSIIEIQKGKKEKSDKKRLDRYATEIISEEEYNKDFHHADALTEIEDINKMILGLYNKKNISSMILFVVGINTGYRPVDLLSWRWCQIVDENGNFLKLFAMPEHKTGKTALVNLNPTAIKALEWFREYKKENEQDFSENNYVFSNMETRGNKSYVWIEKENERVWNTDKKHKTKGLMYACSDGEKVVCDENIILGDNEKFIKLRTPINTDSVSRHFIDCAKKSEIHGHFSSYTIRQTFSYWFRKTLASDDTLKNVADYYFSTRLLSSYFQHSNTKITERHYMRDHQRVFNKVIRKMNLGENALDLIIKHEYEKNNGYGEQISF